MIKNPHARKPVLVVKPSVVNALFPLFFKNLFFFVFLCFGIYFLIIIVNSVFVDLIFLPDLILILVPVFVLTFLSISIKLLLLRRTKYIFYEANVVKEFNLFVIKRRSVVYNRITNVTLKISLWDRLSGAGNITLHTGDDEVPDLVLSFVGNPDKIEELVYSLIHKKNTHLTQTIDK